jgi:hypothetical protein
MGGVVLDPILVEVLSVSVDIHGCLSPLTSSCIKNYFSCLLLLRSRLDLLGYLRFIVNEIVPAIRLPWLSNLTIHRRGYLSCQMLL